MALRLDVALNDVLRVGDDAEIMIERKSGSRVRLIICGKAEVLLMRNARNKDSVPIAPDRQSKPD